jgi:predicted DNA-binding transcriptional regulator YafY
MLPEDEPPGAAVRYVGESLSKGHIDYTPFQDIMETIMKAITRELVCSVEYKASIRAEPKIFEYAPKRLAAYHESLRISGWIVSPEGTPTALYDKPTNFLLHRVIRASLTRRRAKHLPEIEDSSSAFGLMSDEPFVASVRFNESASTYVAEREWSADQKIEPEIGGGVVLTMTARNTPEFVSWVLSFGDAAEVLSPPWLRSEIGELVKKMTALYVK